MMNATPNTGGFDQLAELETSLRHSRGLLYLMSRAMFASGPDRPAGDHEADEVRGLADAMAADSAAKFAAVFHTCAGAPANSGKDPAR